MLKCLFCRKPMPEKKRGKPSLHYLEIKMGLGHKFRTTRTAYACIECTIDDKFADKILEDGWNQMKTALTKC